MTVQGLRVCLTTAAIKLRYRPSVLLDERGIDEFLASLDDSDDGPREICAKAIGRLTHTPTTWVDECICLGVVLFLDRNVGNPAGDVALQRLKDLVQLVKSGASQAAALAWARSWYP
ncbi:MAG: hypothetical protein HYS13_10380 [Planctomycetia bacterium]|nr:hypothetical protein [Planctomycetia bacterium]